MAHDEPQAAGPTRLVIRNIGLLLSGAMEKPILDADTILAENGKITAIGRAKDVNTEGATTIVEANGTTVAPGLIDSHVHPVVRRLDAAAKPDRLDRQLSARRRHHHDLGGRSAYAWPAARHRRPESDGDLRATRVLDAASRRREGACRCARDRKRNGRGGFQGVGRGRRQAARRSRARRRQGRATARKMVGWARKYGIQSTIHTGGPSIPGSGLIDKDVVLEADTDVIGHINGGHTALPDDQIRCICEGCKRGLELVHNGNERAALYTLRIAREMGDLSRVILGTDAPAGSGVQPLGILRMVSLLSSLGEVPAEIAFCFATGNTARMRALDCGLIEVGRSADFVIMDKAQHSAGKDILNSVQLGDLPGVGMTIIDGIVRTQRSRNTPPATKVPEIVGH
jgi:enamidase